MPRVPTVGLNASPSPALQAPGVISPRQAPDDGLGKALQGLGGLVTKIGLEVRDKINDGVTLKATNYLENAANRKLIELSQTKGEAGVDASKDALEWFKEEVNNIRSGQLFNQAQIEQFNRVEDRLWTKFNFKVNSHEVGAAAEFQQQGLKATQLILEDSLKSNPLGPESVSQFLRWRENSKTQIKNEGMSGEAFDFELLSRSSVLVTDLFNSFKDGPRPEDAVAFLAAVEAFEQTPLDVAQGPQGPKSLRGKTYKEAKAAAAETVGAIIDKSTRKKLHEKAEKIALGSWVRDTVNSLLKDSNPADALEQANINAAANGWTGTQLKDVEDRIYETGRRGSLLRNQASIVVFEEAKQEFINNQEGTGAGKGSVSEDTKDKLRKARVYDDYRQWVISPSGGGAGSGARSRSGTSSSTDAGAAYFAGVNNQSSWGEFAQDIKSKAREAGRVPAREDIMELNFHLMTKMGLSKTDAAKITDGVSEILFPEERDEGKFTSSQISNYAGASFNEHNLKSRTSMGDMTGTRGQLVDELDTDEINVQREVFNRDVDRLYRTERKKPANDKKDHHTLLDEVMSAVLKRKELRLPDKDEFGGVNVVNGWFLTNSERQLAYAKIAGPGEILNTLEEMRGTNRFNPDGSYVNETYYVAGVKRAALTKPGMPEAQEAASLLGTYIQEQIAKDAGTMLMPSRRSALTGLPPGLTHSEWAQQNQYKLRRESLRLGLPLDFFEIAGTSPGRVITDEEIFLHGLKIKEEDELRQQHASADGVRSALFFINSYVSDPDWIADATRGMTSEEKRAMAGPSGSYIKSRLLEEKIRKMQPAFLTANKLSVSPRQFEAAMQMHPAIRTRIQGVTTRPYGLPDTGPTKMTDIARSSLRKLHGVGSWRTVTDAEFESLTVVYDGDGEQLETLGGAYFDHSKLTPRQRDDIFYRNKNLVEQARLSRTSPKAISESRERGIQNLMKPQKPKGGLLGQLMDSYHDAPLDGRTYKEAEKLYDEMTNPEPSPSARFGKWFAEWWNEPTSADLYQERKRKAEAERIAEAAERMKGFK